jgi:hypothetical protein
MKNRALGLVVILLMMTCDIPASESDDTYHLYKQYRDDLYTLQKDITHLYGELNQGKNAQAVYEHLLQTVEKTAVLLGKAELASKDIHENLQISLQDHIELTLVRGLSEPHKENLAALQYTEKEITELLDWFVHYNDYNHHAVMGFTPEEMERFYHLGLTDAHIDELQTIMNDHYTHMYTAQQFVKEHQTELMHIQVSLSMAALPILSELNTHTKEKSTLQNVEEKLLKAMLTVSDDKPSLEKVKALSKQMLKTAEQKVRKQSNEYLVDFFIGLQIHCASLTALNGDTDLGLSEIRFYKKCISECISSERPPVLMSENLDLGQSNFPIKGFVGLIEEFDETNNMGVAYVFVKGSDTTLLQSILLLVSFITCIGQPEFSLHHVVDLLTFTIPPTVIIVGAAGAALLLIITAPAVGHEWPPAVPGWIEGDEIIIVVEGSYGQGHIEKRAQSHKECTASSHQAILDDKYMIQKIIVHAAQLLLNPHTGQYVYYYVDDLGMEWAVFVEEYENDYYQLITAYRADCSPHICIDINNEKHEFQRIIKKWLCEGFKLVSLW